MVRVLFLGAVDVAHRNGDRFGHAQAGAPLEEDQEPRLPSGATRLSPPVRSTRRAYNIRWLPRVMWRGPVRSITCPITLLHQCDCFVVGRLGR